MKYFSTSSKSFSQIFESVLLSTRRLIEVFVSLKLPADLTLSLASFCPSLEYFMVMLNFEAGEESPKFVSTITSIPPEALPKVLCVFEMISLNRPQSLIKLVIKLSSKAS